MSSGSIALDIGANIGTFTYLLSKLAGPQGTVLAFEPIPHSFRSLQLACTMYHWRNVRLYNCAISDHIGEAAMELPRNFDGSINYYQCSISEHASSDNLSRVRLISVDSLHLARVDFMKIDVEGHELEALKGAQETLARCKPVILIEISNPETTSFLGRFGYKCSRISSANYLCLPCSLG